MTVKPVVSAEGAPCQTSQTGLVSQACIIGEGYYPQARWQWTEVHSQKANIYIVFQSLWFFKYMIRVEIFIALVSARYLLYFRFLFCSIVLLSIVSRFTIYSSYLCCHNLDIPYCSFLTLCWYIFFIHPILILIKPNLTLKLWPCVTNKYNQLLSRLIKPAMGTNIMN